MGRDDWDGRNGFDLAMLHRSVRRERHELHSALSRFFSLVADASVFNSSWAMEKGKCKKFTSLSLSLSLLFCLFTLCGPTPTSMDTGVLRSTAGLADSRGVFDNPLSHRRNGVHLGLDPLIRRHCDFELFASPLNAAVPNGHFSSKWPHVEWRRLGQQARALATGKKPRPMFWGRDIEADVLRVQAANTKED